MSIIVCNSYRSQNLNNFFILLNKEFSLFNDVLIRYLYRSYLLTKTKLFFLDLLNINNFIAVNSLNTSFIYVLHGISQYDINTKTEMFFLLRYLRYFSNLFVFVYKLSLFFLIKLCNFFLFTNVYVYCALFFFFYRNKGFALPTKRHYETILRSPHGQKKTKEKFVKLLYRRGLKYPSFFVTASNLLMNQLFNKKKGVLIIHKYSIHVS
jgi:hypothetical protein